MNINSDPTLRRYEVPILAFGDEKAMIDTSTRSVFENIGPSFDGSFDMFSISDDGSLFQKSAATSFGEIKFVATASTPACLRRKAAPFAAFKIPISGTGANNIKGGGHPLIEQKGRQAVFLSGAERELITEPGYSVVTHSSPNIQRLVETMGAMLGLGHPAYAATLKLGQDREIPLQIGGISFDQLFTHYFATIRAFEKHPHLLDKLGLEDSFYRCFVMMLSPELFFGEKEISRKRVLRSHSQMNIACEFIRSNLDGVLTLSDIELVSGMSARNLQYAFIKRFGCTPMQWVREQRLNQAHYRLKHAKFGATVTSVATSCGFSKLGEFAQHYFKRFNELPSETLKKALR